MVLMVVVPALCCRSWGERQKGGVACVHMTCSSTFMNIFIIFKNKKIQNRKQIGCVQYYPRVLMLLYTCDMMCTYMSAELN